MKRFWVVLLLLVAPGLAQDAIYVFPPTPHTPVGGIQSIASVVNGTADKTVNWTTSCGTLVGQGSTIGLKSTTAQTCTVTAALATDPKVTAHSVVTFEPVRQDLQAASIHPRIGLTPQDVADLRAKIGSKNIVWEHGLTAYFAAMQKNWDAQFCWSNASCGAVGPSPKFDLGAFAANGGSSYEDDTAIYALMSLIDPDVANRAKWAAHAHDMSMWEMNEICYNAATGSGPCVPRIYDNAGQGTFTPFIGSQYILNNRAQTNTLQEIEAIDWNYRSFSAADKATIAKVGHMWGKQLTGADPMDHTDGDNEHVNPIGAYNTPEIINKNVSDEEGGTNNFSLGHWQALTAIGLLLDAEDDPPIASCASSATTICAKDGTAQTVAAYGVYAVKGWLYRLYAVFEDQHIVDAAYGLSDPYLCPDLYYTGTAPYNRKIPCTGSMSGGFPGEGTGYGYLSMSELFPTLYVLYTAGKLDPAKDPEASFISSAYWDKLAVSAVSQLYPMVPDGSGNYTQIANDQNYSVQNANTAVLFNYMELYDAKHGGAWRKSIDKWFQYNVEPYGYANFFTRFMGWGGNSGSVLGGAMYPVVTMLATSANNDGDFSSGWQDPPTHNEYDPRNAATLPMDFENASSKGGFYHYYGRSNWTTSATEFQYGCNTPAQSHATPVCGRFDFIRENEPLVSGLGGSSNNDGAAQAPEHQNLPEYQWNTGFDCNLASVDGEICKEGGMADSGYGIFSNYVLATSSNSHYYYGATDATGAYNFQINDCQHCREVANVKLSQREVLWLKPDLIFVYDRAETRQADSFKKFVLDLQTQPTISGNTASMTSTHGQKLYITSLLPGNSSLTASALDRSHEPGAPVTTLLTDTAPASASVRMLHVVEGRSSGPASSVALVQSTSGTKFDGGVLGTTAVLFKHTLSESFTSVTYAASGATTQYVTGLTPNKSYVISAAGAPANATTDAGGVLTFAASGAGEVTIRSSTGGAEALANPGELPGQTTQGPADWHVSRHMVRRGAEGLIVLACLCGGAIALRPRKPTNGKRMQRSSARRIEAAGGGSGSAAGSTGT